MIGYLSGKPKVTATSTLIVCNGVGYLVHVTQTNRQQLSTSEESELYVYSHIKEDAFDLYGFLSESEKKLFLQLIDVDGVGPKTALNIMDRGVDAIVHAVQTADVSFFSSVTRVGKKSAQKIIIDLKNKLGGDTDLDLSTPTGKAAEVLEALLSLGFNETQSQKTIKQLDTENMRLEDAVKKAIQHLTKGENEK